MYNAAYSITKTRLFKYIENFMTKKDNFQIKNKTKKLIFFIFLLKTEILDTR